jgi:hypothetical protein
MNIRDLKKHLQAGGDNTLRIVLPGGDVVPADFHVTEVGHVAKSFIDCGGTKRLSAACVLQVWIASNDKEHRLTAGRLGSILELARDIIPSDDLDVEIEYEACAVSQYPLVAVEAGSSELTLTLGSKHTDCLAREACGLESCGCETEEEECCKP